MTTVAARSDRASLLVLGAAGAAWISFAARMPLSSAPWIQA